MLEHSVHSASAVVVPHLHLRVREGAAGGAARAAEAGRARAAAAVRVVVVRRSGVVVAVAVPHVAAGEAGHELCIVPAAGVSPLRATQHAALSHDSKCAARWLPGGHEGKTRERARRRIHVPW